MHHYCSCTHMQLAVLEISHASLLLLHTHATGCTGDITCLITAPAHTCNWLYCRYHMLHYCSCTHMQLAVLEISHASLLLLHTHAIGCTVDITCFITAPAHTCNWLYWRYHMLHYCSCTHMQLAVLE